MTIQEAIKSGKPFRRKGYDYWFFDGIGGIRYGQNAKDRNELARLLTVEILATDWEVKDDSQVGR